MSNHDNVHIAMSFFEVDKPGQKPVCCLLRFVQKWSHFISDDEFFFIWKFGFMMRFQKLIKCKEV